VDPNDLEREPSPMHSAGRQFDSPLTESANPRNGEGFFSKLLN